MRLQNDVTRQRELVDSQIELRRMFTYNQSKDMIGVTDQDIICFVASNNTCEGTRYLRNLERILVVMAQQTYMEKLIEQLLGA